MFSIDHVLACRTLGVQLSESYFFGTTDRGKCVGERSFLGSAVSNRLRVHLSGAKLDAGEPPIVSGSDFLTPLACWVVNVKNL